MAAGTSPSTAPTLARESTPWSAEAGEHGVGPRNTTAVETLRIHQSANAPTPIDERALYSVADLQRVLGCSRRAVYSEFENGLRWAKLGGKRLVLGSDLLAWIKSQRARSPTTRRSR
jgi:hypothetical protein